MLGSGSVVTGAGSAYSKGLVGAQGAEGETMFLCMYTPGSCLGMIVPNWGSSLTQETGSSGHLDCQHLVMAHAPKCFLDDMAGMRDSVPVDVAAVGIEGAGTQAADMGVVGSVEAAVADIEPAAADTGAAAAEAVVELVVEAMTVAGYTEAEKAIAATVAIAGTQDAGIGFAAAAVHQPAEADETG